jgi:ribosomal protein S18 acetylase RimI-like enzyme
VKTDIDLNKYRSFGAEALEFLKNQSAGWFLSLAVKSAYRKLGIGRKLSEMQFQWLKLKNCTMLVGSSWQSGSSDNSGHLYRSAGFQKLGESQEYLRVQSQQTGFICTVCKNECQCRSVLYGLAL